VEVEVNERYCFVVFVLTMLTVFGNQARHSPFGRKKFCCNLVNWWKEQESRLQSYSNESDEMKYCLWELLSRRLHGFSQKYVDLFVLIFSVF
jgi:hypothetical protein